MAPAAGAALATGAAAPAVERSTSGSGRQHQQHRSNGVPQRGWCIRSQYCLADKIGSGSFGEIFAAVDLVNNLKVAVKLEPAKQKHPHLLFECRVYKLLQCAAGIPRLHYYGTHQNYNVMIIDLLGPSLEDLFTTSGRRFGVRTTVMLADQMLQRLEYVHSRNFIHRDIKPHNFLVGRVGDEQERVYMIDFGLAKRYRDAKTNAHIPYREGRSLTGTARYVSVNTHLGIEQSRRDDVESLGYVFIYFLRGFLPWQGLRAFSRQDKYARIKDKKMLVPVATLTRGLPRPFAAYMNYCRSLRFHDKPDYAWLRKIFRNLVVCTAHSQIDRSPVAAFDWRVSGTLSSAVLDRLASQIQARRDRQELEETEEEEEEEEEEPEERRVAVRRAGAPPERRIYPTKCSAPRYASSAAVVLAAI